MDVMVRVRVTRLGTRLEAGLLSSLQRVELHRHRVWRCKVMGQFPLLPFVPSLTTISLSSDL